MWDHKGEKTFSNSEVECFSQLVLTFVIGILPLPMGKLFSKCSKNQCARHAILWPIQLNIKKRRLGVAKTKKNLIIKYRLQNLLLTCWSKTECLSYNTSG